MGFSSFFFKLWNIHFWIFCLCTQMILLVKLRLLWWPKRIFANSFESLPFAFRKKRWVCVMQFLSPFLCLRSSSLLLVSLWVNLPYVTFLLKGLCSYALWPYSIHWIPQGSLHCYRVWELLFLVFPVVMQAEMKIFQSFDPVYLRLQYERKLEELEEEKQSLQVKFCISFGKESLGWLHVTTVLSTTHFVSSIIIVSLFS